MACKDPVPKKNSVSSNPSSHWRIKYRNDSVWLRASFARLSGRCSNNPVLSAGSLKVKFYIWKGGSAPPCITSPGPCKCLLDPVVSSGLFKLKHCFFSRQAR